MSSDFKGNMALLDSQFNLHPRCVSPTAALLLDVENFSSKLDLEKYIKAYCAYPITIKFAVANWQNNSIANLDLFLHKQRYQLIHVPKGKNAADAQILTLGTSLLLQYPQITEIIVASHDSIFDYLHHTLISLGCKTYKVYQKSNNIYIKDILNNRIHTIAIPKENLSQNDDFIEQSPTQSIKSKVLSNIESVINKINDNQNKEVPINSLCLEYKKEYKKNLSEVLKKNKLGSSPLKFLKNSCSEKITINQKNNLYYLSLK